MIRRGLSRRQLLSGLAVGIVPPLARATDAGAEPASSASPLRLALTSTRARLTTAEPVEVVLIDDGAIGTVSLIAQHEDGSAIALRLPGAAPGAAPAPRPARVITLPAGMLKPGAYTLVASDGAATTPGVRFAVDRDEHESAYFVAGWTVARPDAATVLAKGGWMYFTSDLVAASVRKPEPDDVIERYTAARMKPFSRTVMGGGHQLDMDLTNDWGDPWVQRAVTWKMGLAALSNRIYERASAGLSAFDEPGLTWWPLRVDAPAVVSANPFATPVHLEELRKLTGQELPTGPLGATMPTYKAKLGTWIDFIAMRLKYLEQSGWAAVTAVSQVYPRFITFNQLASSYAPGSVTDGVDNRMNRAYRVLSGHGGYSDFAGSWGPVISARAYDGWSWDRPHWFLPMWGGYDYARMRQEVWLAWSTKLEGILYDPNHVWDLSGSYTDATAVLEIAEVNRRLALVGDVMRRMPRSLAPAAVLLSHTQYAHDLASGEFMPGQPGWTIAYRSAHRDQVVATMWRALGSGLVPNWVDEYEVVEKGAAFLGQWKVVYCPGLAIAKPELRAVLESYVSAGGRLVQGKGDPLAIAGSTRVDYAYAGGDAPPVEGALFNDLALREHGMALAPGFDADLSQWVGPRAFRSNAPLNAMLLNEQRSGEATYVLMANASHDPLNTRHTQMAPVPLETTIDVPARGTIYDLLEGGTVAVEGGKAHLSLAAGDGACWLHLPSAPGPLKLAVESARDAWALDVAVTWGTTGYLPFRLRVLDPSGAVVEELLRATTPCDSVPLSYGPSEDATSRVSASGATVFRHRITLGANAPPGTWAVEAYEWLTGSRAMAHATLRTDATLEAATIDASAISIYFDDARKIRELFDGRADEPPFDKMHWDCRRVFGLDRRRFAVFGPRDDAGSLAAALRAKGMTVTVNPEYAIVPFVREPGHGGTGPIVDRGTENFENIAAHTIVLPGHELGRRSWERGHINRPTTATFPGPGRAYVQWGVGGYQAGFENVWVFGDTAAGVRWLLAAIDGKDAAGVTTSVAPSIRPARARPRPFPGPAARFRVTQEIKVRDTPAGVDASPDGKVIYVLLAGGTVAAYDRAGAKLWSTRALLEGVCLAASPRGDRLVVGGFPGLLVLDSANGTSLGGYRVPLPAPDQSRGLTRFVAAAWSSDGAMVAGGGTSEGATAATGESAPALPIVRLDAQGRALPGPTGIAGDVMGVAFVPKTSTLLIGARALTAVDASTGNVKWQADIGHARAIAFSGDATTAAAGGFGKRAGLVDVRDGKLLRAATFASNVGGVAILPGGDVAVAVWGGAHPLYRLGAEGAKPGDVARARFAFHDVRWLASRGAAVAAEQGGNLWLLDPTGTPRAKLEDAGTTAHRMVERGGELIVGRMNRVVQRVTV